MKLSILPNGNLEVSITDEDPEDILSNMRGDDWTRMFEEQIGNGYEIVCPEDIGALTCAPIVSDDVVYHDDGKREVLGRVWWFPNYQVEDPAETLAARGKVVFQYAGKASVS